MFASIEREREEILRLQIERYREKLLLRACKGFRDLKELETERKSG